MNFDFVTSPLPPGLSVVEASAGTGKTHAISHLVPRLLLDGTISHPREILLVTFTNDAARELAERVRRVFAALAHPSGSEHESISRLRGEFGAARTAEVARRFLPELDQLAVSTIHSFCQGVLHAEGTLCGMPVVPDLVPDAGELLERLVLDRWESRMGGDARLAEFAHGMEWNPGSDLPAASAILGLDEWEWSPAVTPGFEKTWEAFCHAPERFSSEVLAALTAWDARVPAWNKAGADPLLRKGYYNTLGHAADMRSWMQAVTWLAKVEELVTARSRDGKEARAQGGELAAVRMAKDILREAVLVRWAWRTASAEHVRGCVIDALRGRGEITYDGLIVALRDALRGPHGGELARVLRGKYRVALIDESQDTDPRQFEIFEKIFVDSELRLVLVGDPKQAIYAFRGADVNTYLAAREMAAAVGGNRVFSLNRTYRAPAPLVRAINAIFERPNSFLKEGLLFEPACSGIPDVRLVVPGENEAVRVEYRVVSDEVAPDYSSAEKRAFRLAGGVADEIARLLECGARLESEDPSTAPRPVEPGDFCVLVNNHFEAADIVDALARAGIPAIRGRGADIMLSEEAGEVLLLLRALDAPRRASLRGAALAGRLFGLDALAVSSEGTSSWPDHFIAWQSVWHAEGPAALFAAIDSTLHREGAPGLIERLTRLPDGERRATNLRQIIDLMETASADFAHRPEALLRWLASQISKAGSQPPEERQAQLESDATAVKIVTMHSAKGLEFPLVFCPYLWSFKQRDGIYTLGRKGDSPVVMDRGLAEPAVADALARAEFEDRLRLIYVALTRAKVKLWIWCGAVADGKAATPLDWLLREDTSTDFDAWKQSDFPARGSAHRRVVEAMARHLPVVIRDAANPTGVKWSGPRMESRPVPAARTPPDIPHPWGMTSFSGLTREKNPRAPTEEGNPPVAATREVNAFFSAPGGTLVGTALHEWIEGWDFGSLSMETLRVHFAKYPMPATEPEWAIRAEDMLSHLARAVLPGAGCTVAEACPDPAASEWHFQMPLRETIGPHELAEVFEHHGYADYAAQLSVLPAGHVRGYLHGFLDRLAKCGPSWGVIDWKTNLLGSSIDDYREEALMACAQRSHYFLQAHLYLVALRRHRPGALAGAWLVFLRAVRGGTPDGILHIHPPAALLADLDRLFTPPLIPERTS